MVHQNHEEKNAEGHQTRSRRSPSDLRLNSSEFFDCMGRRASGSVEENYDSSPASGSERLKTPMMRRSAEPTFEF
jgi:hypothetical protein